MIRKEVMDLDIYKELVNEFSKVKVKACVIKRNGKIVLDYHKNDKMATKQHKINSCTKSITSALIGICIDKGLIDGLDVTIERYFAEHLLEDEKKEITIRHLLTMTDGLDWPELEEWNGFAPMLYQKDMAGYVLGRNLIHHPGEHMNYNSGASQLLGEIITISTGMSVVEFAKKELLEPLGIHDFTWWEREGHALTADGLKMTMEDMVKFGELYLNKGIYKGKRILPEKWIEESFIPRFLTYTDIGSYGYHWWHTNALVDEKLLDINFALGIRGQYVIVIPAMDMVIAITGDLEDSMFPLRVVKRCLEKGGM